MFLDPDMNTSHSRECSFSKNGVIHFFCLARCSKAHKISLPFEIVLLQLKQKPLRPANLVFLFSLGHLGRIEEYLLSN